MILIYTIDWSIFGNQPKAAWNFRSVQNKLLVTNKKIAECIALGHNDIYPLLSRRREWVSLRLLSMQYGGLLYSTQARARLR